MVNESKHPGARDEVEPARNRLGGFIEHPLFSSTPNIIGQSRSSVVFKYYGPSGSGVHGYGYRYYNPGSGRWLNRDSIEENGGIGLYSFVENDSQSFFDVLGKQTSRRGWKKPPHEPSNSEPVIVNADSLYKMLFFKPCGALGRRAAKPQHKWWSPLADTLSFVGAPHYFVELENGKILDHGGSLVEDKEHWTVAKTQILIPKCMSCKEFTNCMLKRWPKNDLSYNMTTDNCKSRAMKEITSCGGVIANRGFLYDLFVPNGPWTALQTVVF